jgi:hypothetical protein
MGIAAHNPVVKGDENRFDSQFQTMKAWPQLGSIKVVDQNILIKLNDEKQITIQLNSREHKQ